MSKRPYEFRGKDYQLWWRVGEKLGATAQAGVAHVLKNEPEKRRFDHPDLQVWMSTIRAIAAEIEFPL